MPNDIDKIIEERLKKEVEEYIPKIKAVIKEYSQSDMLVQSTNECLRVFEDPNSTKEQIQKALVVVENAHLDFLLSEKRKGSK